MGRQIGIQNVTDDVDEAVAIDVIVITNSMLAFDRLDLVVAVIAAVIVHLDQNGQDADELHEFVAVDLMPMLVAVAA